MGSYFQGADLSWNTTAGIGTNEACLRDNPDSKWKCLMAQYIVPYLETDLFVMNAAIDVYQVQHILEVGCVPGACSTKQFDQMEEYRKEFLQALTPVLAKPSNGAWIDSCIMHEQNVYYCGGGHEGGTALNCQGWMRERVNDLSPRDAFSRWYASRGKLASNFVIDNVSWPLNPTCSWHFKSESSLEPQLPGASELQIQV